MTDFNVRLRNQDDLQTFSDYIKEAVCDSFGEHFGSLRLRESRLVYDDFFHKSNRSMAHASGLIEVRQTESALQLAGTIVHEMAHVLVGTNHNHDDVWHEAGTALGLLVVEASGQNYIPEHFRSDLLTEIRLAIEKLYKDHPEIVYPSDIPIPVPDYVGWPECPGYSADYDDCEFGHKVHVKPFQREGVRWMLANPNNILLADEPGLGKTVSAMLYINATHPKSVLTICPNNVKLVWRDHFNFWCVHDDLKSELEMAYTQRWTFGPVVIMSYEAARRHKDMIKTMDWDLFISDEMHYCKTPSSQRSKAVYSFKAKKVIGITGTPIVNFIDEIFPIIHYLHPERWREFGNFSSRYMSSGNRFGRNLGEFNSIMRETIMLRRFKKDVLKDLPQKRRNMIELEVEPEIIALIEEEKRLWADIQGAKNDSEMVKMLNAMRNDSDTAVDDIDWARIVEEMQQTKRYAFERMAIIAHQIGLAKVPLAIEYITNALESKEKVAIFGHHRDVLRKIADHFKPNSVLLLGGGASDDTFMMSQKFSNDDSCNVFVGGFKLAAGYSLKGTSTVIFVEEDWVPGIMTQAEDRCHGLGRGEKDATSLMIHHLVFEDSLDTYKAKRTMRKQKSIDRATGKV